MCPECGARLEKGAEQCDLCGAPQEWTISAAEPSPDFEDQGAARTSPGGDEAAPVHTTSHGSQGELSCQSCGWENPHDARFCSQCGARLQNETRLAPTGARSLSRRVRPADERAAGSTTRPRDDAALGQHIAVLVGLAVLIVVALFLITVVSKERPEAGQDGTDAVPAAARAASVIQDHEAIPIDEQHRGRVDSLLSAVESEQTLASMEARHQLVEFLIDIGRIDRAAIEQLRLAELSEDVNDWRTSGNLLLDWMEVSDSESRTQIALLAIDAYKRVLERQPDDLEARADLGWAYQYDPQNPMEAIRQTNIVLEQDADHLMANYNKGVFLMRINRIDQALDQFERVKDLAGRESRYYEQADMWITTIRQSQDAS